MALLVGQIGNPIFTFTKLLDNQFYHIDVTHLIVAADVIDLSEFEITKPIPEVGPGL